ncbi:MAG: hypothetical protein EXR75_16150 [Myxococcales bacterium]|nr:hypothetical protein [Myxococcales bacterium]
MMARWTFASAVGAIAALGMVGCVARGPGAIGPSETLHAYARALEAGRADDAYRYLTGDAKRTVSLEAFRRIVKESPADVREIALALYRPSSEPMVTAKVVGAGGEELGLVYEAGKWAVDGTGIDRYGQGSPRQALLGFLRAYHRKRFDVVLRYVPNAELEGRADGWSGAAEGLTAGLLEQAWTGPQKEQIASIVLAIEAALPTAKLEETEDRAAMAYGAGATVLFVREGGAWKLEDLE